MTTKRCSRCGEEKSRNEFYKQSRQLDGLNRWCKACVSDYRKERRAARKAAGLPHENYNWQKANWDKHLADRAQRRRNQREWLRSLKEGKPCVDCGGVFDPVAMDWDHLDPETKSYTIMGDAVIRLLRREKVLEEIAKCELVCANCHRVRTRDRLAAKKAVILIGQA